MSPGEGTQDEPNFLAGVALNIQWRKNDFPRVHETDVEMPADRGDKVRRAGTCFLLYLANRSESRRFSMAHWS